MINLLFETKDAKYNMHIEIFSKGNIIFCDKDDIVLSATEYQEFKDRKIKPKQAYGPPTRETNFLKIDRS